MIFNFLKCCLVLLVIANFQYNEALECYVCRGCKDASALTQADIQTCPSLPVVTEQPTDAPTLAPTVVTDAPTEGPTDVTDVTTPPTVPPTAPPTTTSQTFPPTVPPTVPPTIPPTIAPTNPPTVAPTIPPTVPPTVSPTVPPTIPPTVPPTVPPTNPPTVQPTVQPTETPTILTDNVGSRSRFLMRTKRETAAEYEPRCVVAFYEVNSETNVVRGCSTVSEQPQERCQQAVGDDEANVTSCVLCAGDLCNSSTRPAIGLATVVLLLVHYFRHAL